MSFGYPQILDALDRGEVASIAIRPPHVLLVTFATHEPARTFLHSPDREFRVAALLTFMDHAHTALLEETA